MVELFRHTIVLQVTCLFNQTLHNYNDYFRSMKFKFKSIPHYLVIKKSVLKLIHVYQLYINKLYHPVFFKGQ